MISTIKRVEISSQEMQRRRNLKLINNLAREKFGTPQPPSSSRPSDTRRNPTPLSSRPRSRSAISVRSSQAACLWRLSFMQRAYKIVKQEELAFVTKLNLFFRSNVTDMDRRATIDQVQFITLFTLSTYNSLSRSLLRMLPNFLK